MNNSTKRVTKKTYLNFLRALVNYAEESGASVDVDGVTYEGLHEFITSQLNILDNRATFASKKAAERRAEGDALRERIYQVLDTERYMSIAEIAAEIDDPDVSSSMIIARLSQLSSPEVNRVEKGYAAAGSKGGRTRKTVVYRAIAN